MPFRLVLGFWAVAVALAVAPWWCPPAFAYVRTTSDKSGVAVQWLQRCLIIRPDSRGSQDLSRSQIEEALGRAVQNWSSRTDACSDLRLEAAPANGAGSFGIDSRPTVLFRDQSWVRPGTNTPRDSSIIALTTVFYVDTPGFVGDATILDADVELNGVNYTFALDTTTATPRPGTDLADLENTLTHELGHVQGLGHTCWDHVRETPPVDDHGQPIPDCRGALPQAVLDTTMYPYPLSTGETSKRNLSDDDVDGVCQPYPASETALACHQEIDGGCSIAVGARGSPLVMWLCLLVVLRLRP